MAWASKEARNEYQRKWRNENRELVRRYWREWYARNPEPIREKNEEWRKANLDKSRGHRRKAMAKIRARQALEALAQWKAERLAQKQAESHRGYSGRLGMERGLA